jgi:hypothetical protein
MLRCATDLATITGHSSTLLCNLQGKPFTESGFRTGHKNIRQRPEYSTAGR